MLVKNKGQLAISPYQLLEEKNCWVFTSEDPNCLTADDVTANSSFNLSD